MSGTVFFQADPVYTARRLHSEGQGEESNPFAYETDDHETFRVEIERLQIEEMKQEAQQP
jgi:hypothetical protein